MSALRVSLVVFVLLVLGLMPAARAGVGSPGGHACSAYVDAPRLGTVDATFADTDVASVAGDPVDGADLIQADVPGVLSAEVLTATTSVDFGMATSATSLANVRLLPGQAAELTASFVRAQADVYDAQGSSRWHGVTEIRDLTFGGRSVALTGKANQRIDLPGVASLVINEQATSMQSGVSTLTVNALHLTLASGDQFVLAAARSAWDRQATTVGFSGPDRARPRGDVRPALARGPLALARPRVLPAHEIPECKDFVTGGGWFEPRYEGGPPMRVNFGFNAGYRSPNDKLLGHVNFVDHNDGTHIQGVDVDTYARLGDPQSLCRMFEGDAKMNGASGFRYHVEVCDYGEPGRDDRFRIVLFDSAGTQVYFADDSDSTKTCPADEPRCGDLDGGNIQLHKNCDAPPKASSPMAPALAPQPRT